MKQTTNLIPHITLLQTFAVFCVILGHALAIYGASQYLVPPFPNASTKALHSFIYAFHMPIFLVCIIFSASTAICGF